MIDQNFFNIGFLHCGQIPRVNHDNCGMQKKTTAEDGEGLKLSKMTKDWFREFFYRLVLSIKAIMTIESPAFRDGVVVS